MMRIPPVEIKKIQQKSPKVFEIGRGFCFFKLKNLEKSVPKIQEILFNYCAPSIR